MKKQFHRLYAIFAMIGCLLASAPSGAQNISQIAKSDPLLITGAIGTSNTYYHSSLGSDYTTPFSNTIYANLNISLYGFSMPFSFYYSNNNVSFNYPKFSFNISPTYKNWRLYLGRRSMAFSNYVFNLPFNGVGLEYQGASFRFGAFYGTLRNAINDDPENPIARSPQYQRVGWGAKVGLGNSSNYLDFYFLRAKDDINSISATWHEADFLSMHGITDPFAQENMVVGAKGRLSLKNYVSLTGNVATSVFSTDINSQIIPMERFQRWDKVFEARYSSLARFAGDLALNFNLGSFATALQYKIIQPDYKSLGASYMTNNIQSLGAVANWILFKRLTLSGSFAQQSDNLNNQQMYTTKGFVYTAGAGLSLGSHLSLSAYYNGYLQCQYDGAAIINDTIRVDRKMDSYTFSPSYSFYNDSYSHTISVSGCYASNKDLNPFTSAENHTDVNTLSSGVSYGLGLLDLGTDIMTAYSHQESVGYGYHYQTEVVSAGASHAFLEDKTLDVSLTLNCCFNKIDEQDRNVSIGGDLTVGYTLKDVHVFSFSAGYNKFNDINILAGANYGYSALTMSLNYNYAFTLLQIKRKAEEATVEIQY